MFTSILNPPPKNSFTIDFFEFSFLVEACIPPVPIARGMFWDKVIDEHFYTLSQTQRDNLFEWITRCPKFKMDNEGCSFFYHRFNPDNQYQIKGYTFTIFFKIDNRYYATTNTFIEESDIDSLDVAKLYLTTTYNQK